MNSLMQRTVILPAVGIPPIRLPLFSHKVAAGFPSPADDYIQDRLSLDEHLIHHKESTFFVRAKGNSMVGVGIHDGNILVVDKSLKPSSGNIVVAFIDGEYTVKTFIKRDETIILRPENPRYKAIEFKEGQILEVWGVVTSTVKKFI
jgi:DNA polymerase V